MNKNKDRVDLLSAGRKKLQQFRQKKDGKASGSIKGKSAKKSTKQKHLHDSSKTKDLSQVPPGEDIDSSAEPGDVANCLANDAQLAQEPEILQQDVDSSVSGGVEGAMNVDDPDRTGETVSSDRMETVIEDEGRDPLPIEEYIHDVSSVTARGDQMDNSDLSRTLSLIREEKEKLEDENELLSRKNQDLSVEFDECKRSLASLRVEKSNLDASLASMAEDRKKLEDDRIHFVHETERLNSELLDLQEQFSKERGDRMQLETDVKELTERIEQLMKENMLLHSNQDVHKAKLTESDCEGGQTAVVESQVRADNATLDLEVFDDSCGFVGMKRHVEETEKLLAKFEKAIDGLHSHSVLLNESDGKGGVSKLIQAFEHKAHNDEDELEVEEGVLNDIQLPVDPFTATKELVGEFREMFKLLVLDAERTDELLKIERDCRRSVESNCNELREQYDGLLEHSIELGVLYEAAKLHASEVDAKKNELEIACEGLLEHSNSLEGVSIELGVLYEAAKLHASEVDAKKNELEIAYEGLLEHSDSLEAVSVELGVLYEAAKLHASEVDAKKNELEIAYEGLLEHSNSLEGVSIELGVLYEVAKLHASEVDAKKNELEIVYEGLLEHSNSLEGVSIELGVLYEAAKQHASEVDAKKNELEIAYEGLLEYSNSLEGVSIELGVLYEAAKLHASEVDAKKKELEIVYAALHLQESSVRIENAELGTKLSNYEVKVSEMESQFDDFQGRSDETASALRNELEMLQKKVAEREATLEKDWSFSVTQIYEAVTRLEKYLDTNVSRGNKAAISVATVIDVIENIVKKLPESTQKFDPLQLQHEIQILVLEESLHQAEESIHATATTLQGKICELEQSEQRVSSIREKLSIAVAKGKGLIVQRDSLKQTLAETSSELDRCSQELQLNDARVEALESELSYIRNSATAIRESFLLKDSTLQRIEEILEDLDLPENFHFADMIEKVDWLARSVAADFELQRKFFELAEQNEMLEQSLLERNHLVQRWEELLNQIHMPSHLQTMEVDDKIEWLGTALLEVSNERDSLQEKIDKLEGFGSSLTADLEDSQKKIIDLQAELQSNIHEMEHLSERFHALLSDHDELSAKAVLAEQENERLHAEVTGLQDKLVEKLRLLDTEGSISRLEEIEVASLKKQLQEALQELESMNEERDRYSEKEQSLLSDVEELHKKKDELLELLNQEEQKSASLKEKLNIAVKKGKLVVQQRDDAKQTLENTNTELGCLKSEISRYENSVADYEIRIKELSSHYERVEGLGSENDFLRKRLEESERTLTHVLNKLADIDIDVVVHTSDPVEKLEKIAKLCYDLNSTVASSEQELSKSKRALELLLAELNEVQERNDGLQEELMKERDEAEAAKLEALSHAEKLSSIHAEEERKKCSETQALISNLNQLRCGLSDIFNLSFDTFSSNLELLKDLEASIVSCLKGNDAGVVSSRILQNKEVVWSPDSWPNADMPEHFDDNFTVDAGGAFAHHMQEFMNDIGALKEKLNVHLKSLEGQASSVSSVVGVLQKEMASQKESFEALKGDIVHLESTQREKEMEIATLSRNIALLYEACANAVTEIESRKIELSRNNLSSEDTGSLKPVDSSSEECVKTMADMILAAMNEFAAVKSDVAAGGLKEMEIIVANLQKEMHEKDIEKDRVCMELVDQVKRAEVVAADYLQEYNSSKTLACDLEKQVEQMQREREFLEQRVKDLHDVQSTSMELQYKVGSLTEKLSAKDQEIEALMQALDEEEAQKEELRRKIEGLEEVVQKKNVDLENMKASHTKVVKKLAITVSKFDELHDLSESLLSEVEKLQSQLQDRDAEISFLRNEVTRCTNDVLVASQLKNKRDSDDLYELLAWFDAMVSRVEIPGVHDDKNNVQAHECKEALQKKISIVISQLEDIQMVAQSKDALLQAEKSKVEELILREEILEKTLHEKESQLNLLQSMGDSGQATGSSSNTEIVEVEPMVNKWAVSGTSSASQVRSLRKGNNDQVAIDMDPVDDTSRLEDEDDEKAHGFKSLTTSRIIPKFTRPITDMVDGLWVSCDRALMRQPALRMCIMMYWATLHALLAAFVF